MPDFIPDKKTDGDQAEFNNAFAFLERLNKLEYLIEDGLMKWNLKETLASLESYENEIAFSFKGDDQTNVNELKQKIIDSFNKYPRLGETGRDAAWNKIIIGGKVNGEVRDNLILLNKLLRAIKHKRGMGMPTKGEGKLF